MSENLLFEHHWTNLWPFWFVSAALVVAAVIDGMKLKVPNWITLPLILSGWVLNLAVGGWAGLGMSLLGTVVGLGLLLPAYAIGGMGAGDVKLLAGVGAWIRPEATLIAFCWSAIAGGAIALVMVVTRRGFRKHKDQFLMIFNEIVTIGNPNELSVIAAERKSSMMLLPAGIWIAIGTIAWHFALRVLVRPGGVRQKLPPAPSGKAGETLPIVSKVTSDHGSGSPCCVAGRRRTGRGICSGLRSAGICTG